MTEQRAPHTWHRFLAGPAFGAALLGLVQAPAGVPAAIQARVLGQKFAASGDNGNGKNNGAGNDKKDFTIAGSVSGLYPGAVRPLVLTLANQNNFAIRVSTFSVAVARPNPGCAAANVRVEAFPPDVVLPKNGSTTATVVVRMRNDAPDACKDAAFGLTYSGTAVKA